MRNRRSWIYLILIIGALIGMNMLLGHVPAYADCTNDTDCDGFTNTQETSGIVFANSTCICGSGVCPGNCSTTSRADRLDPNSPDVFYILVQASGGYFNSLTNPLQYVSNSISAGGLEITLHQINQNQVSTCGTPPSNRCVTSSQKAVRVTESLNIGSTNPLGFANTGTPNGPDLATVYTARINNFIRSVCGNLYGGPNCADSTGAYDKVQGTTNDYALTKKYIIHTINHEVAHMFGPLAPVYDANSGGYHYPTGTNVVMDQSAYYKANGSPVNSVTFYLGNTFTTVDQAGIALK